jgi:hypothetical protein
MNSAANTVTLKIPYGEFGDAIRSIDASIRVKYTTCKKPSGDFDTDIEGVFLSPSVMMTITNGSRLYDEIKKGVTHAAGEYWYNTKH